MQTRSQFVLKKVGLVALFFALLVLPSMARIGYYYRGWYVAPGVQRPDHAAIDVPPLDKQPFQEADIRQVKGKVVVDRAHGNTVEEAELGLLLSHLTARGLESVSLTEADALGGALRDAAALVVIAPHEAFSVDEVQVVRDWVERGGRVLLVADPSRYAWEIRQSPYGEYEVVESDVPAINGLASPFGLAFSNDYIYNTTHNAGNYQYVILTHFAPSPLTAGLDQVIFYAAHSIASDQETLIEADEHTTSSLSEQVGDLAVMSLGGNGQVLAVSDWTFMLEPYSAAADNSQLLANIADFLAGARRIYSLTDFPLFFGPQVVVVPLWDKSDPVAFSADKVEQLAGLKTAFEKTGRSLFWQAPAGEADTVYVGLYANLEFWPEVSEVLAGQGITLTLQTVEQQRATPTPTPRWTPTPTPTPKTTPTPTPTPRPLRDWIHFADIGQVEAREAALFYRYERESRQVLIVLAWSEEGLKEAVQRLASSDWEGCLVDEGQAEGQAPFDLALCPTLYEAPEGEPSPTATLMPTSTSPAQGEAQILIVSDNDGEPVYEAWTSAYDFEEAAVDAGYQVVVWSTALDGQVTLDQVMEYDTVIWCAGDYREQDSNPEEADLNILDEYLNSGGRLLLAGAFIGESQDRESGLLLDVQVAEADHPLTYGFDPDQVIVLKRFTADQDYAPFVMESSDALAVWVRGPKSEYAGTAVVRVQEDDATGNRLALFGFPIYLLPTPDRHQLAVNVVVWLMDGR